LPVLIGAELDAGVDDMWPDAKTQQGRRAARDRRAIDAADPARQRVSRRR
jgi:hypothetical protein